MKVISKITHDILDSNKHKDYEEMYISGVNHYKHLIQLEDLIQIVMVFSARLQGKRAHKAKKMVEELTNNDSDKEG